MCQSTAYILKDGKDGLYGLSVSAGVSGFNNITVFAKYRRLGGYRADINA